MYALGELAWNIGNEKRGKLFSRRKKRVEYKSSTVQHVEMQEIKDAYL